MAVLGTTRHPCRRLCPTGPASRSGRHRQHHDRRGRGHLPLRRRPDGLVYKPCGTRRASVCPSCARTYQYDAYHLLKAGLAGSRSAGVPEDVALRPVVLLTLTAPSFGLVHGLRTTGGKPMPCRARRDKPLCPHGRPAWCSRRHRPGDPVLGKPLCLDCYDHDAHVVWNHHASELWRRTSIALRRAVTRLGRPHG